MDCIGFSRFGTGRHGRWLVAWMLCLLGWTLSAAPPTPSRGSPAALPRPAPDGHRFLFVVDISSGMRSTDAANRQALFDMLFTGIDGQMRTGDTFGLWFYNDTLHAGVFPMQIWDEQDPLPAAGLATKFLREQPYSGKSRPEALMPPLQNLIKVVRDVNVFVISHGKPPLQGTPYDTNITALVRRKRSDRESAQKPFVTALIVRNGTIVNGAVIIPGEALLLPARPRAVLASVAAATNTPAPPPKPKGIVHSLSTSEVRVRGSEVLTPGAKTETRNPQPGTATANPEPETTNPELLPRGTATFATQPATPATPSANPPSPKPKVLQMVTRTNVVATNAVITSVPTQENSTRSSESRVPGSELFNPGFEPGASNLELSATTTSSEPGTRNPEQRQQASAQSASGSPVKAFVTSLSQALDAEPVPVAARSPSADGQSAPAPAVLAATPGPSAALLLTIGVVLLTACVGLLVLVLRRLRPRDQTSFITRSMELR